MSYDSNPSLKAYFNQQKTREVNGWLLDLYEDPDKGVKLWLIGEDEQRQCFYQDLPLTFYAAGPAPRLRALWRWLSALPDPPSLSRQERKDLFFPDLLPVLAIQVKKPSGLRPLFQQVERAFPDLTYYDADVQVQIHHSARFNTFPMAHCRLEVGPDDYVHNIEVLDSRWDIDPDPVPLRVMSIKLDKDPRHNQPTRLLVQYRTYAYVLPLLDGETPAFWLKTALQKHDPDILITDFGDTWLLDFLLESVHHDYEKLPINRDPDRPVTRIREKSYFTYGQVVYRGQQIHLFGRIHIDRTNAMMWSDYSLDGILENARVTSLPIQTSARVSPGTGISSMQMTVALQTGVLVPWHKQQAERPKTALELIHADFGGLAYQPIPGLHRDVGEIDFVSLYPAIMVRCNISPEKTPITLDDPPAADPGLIPQTLAPLLEKRIALKQSIASLPPRDARRELFKARASAEKWLLVVCFGYLGYRNARFGRIESHEAVTAGGRDALLLAKEAAEDADYLVLHMYVDGLWVQKEGYKRTEDYQPLLDEIRRRTGIKIALDGIYRWVVFLPSRVDSRVPVPNRYFGVFQDGTIKVRGLETRRHDTSLWVSETQTNLLRHLAQAEDADHLPDYLPGAIELLRQELGRLRRGKIPFEELLVAQKLSRELAKYADPSPAARAAMQLEAIGKPCQPGQRIRFLLTLGKPGVYAWDLPDPPDRRTLDLAAYTKLLLRAAENILMPMGITASALRQLVVGRSLALPLIAEIPSRYTYI